MRETSHGTNCYHRLHYPSDGKYGKLIEHSSASDTRGAQRIVADSCPTFGVIRNCEEPVNDMESPSPHRKRRTITWPMGTQAQ